MTSTAQQRLSRRAVLNSAVAAGAFLVAGRLGSNEVYGQGASAALNAWIAIAPDGSVTLQCAHSEMGQGIETTFAAIIADELEADWTRVKVVFAPAAAPFRHPLYNWQFTGNAESTRSYHALIRRMGAAAREMLIAEAAGRLKVAPAALQAREGVVRHPGSGRGFEYGALAADAARRAVPAAPNIKPESEWRLVGGGRSLARIDIPAKVTGAATYGVDVKVPGMAHAAVVSAPTIGGRIVSVDDTAARAMPGVIATVALGAAVAVVAEHWWQARTALEKLDISWSDGPGGRLDTASLDALYRAALGGASFAVAESHGDARRVLSGASRVLDVEYWSPWQAHAPMEPMNATVSVTPDGATVWAPTQGPQMTQIVLAGVLGIDPAQGDAQSHLSGRRVRTATARGLHRAGRAVLEGGRAAGQADLASRGGLQAGRLSAGIPRAHPRNGRSGRTAKRAAPADRRPDDPGAGVAAAAEGRRCRQSRG
jgi:isoquinoline 1-oxidoreductase beta subunit